MTTEPPAHRWPTRIVRTIAAGLMLLGLHAVVVWHLGAAAARWNSPAGMMRYNAAVAFFLTGASLLAISMGKKRLGLLFGGLVALTGLLTLGQQVFHVDFRMDRLLFRPLRNPVAGRMAEVTALGFAASGLALLAAAAFPRRPAASMVAGVLGSGVSALGMMSVLGYFVGLNDALGWEKLTQTALHAAAGFIAAGAALLILAWQSDAVRTRRPPRWLPFATSLMAFCATLVLWYALGIRERREMERTVQANAAAVRSEIVSRLDSRIRSLGRMARRWEYTGKLPREFWEADAASFMADDPGYLFIAKVNPGLRIEWITPPAAGTDLAAAERLRPAWEMARDTHEARFTRPLELGQDGRGILAIVPIYRQERFEGFIVGAIRLRQWMDATLTDELASGYTISLSEGGGEIYARPAGARPRWPEWVAELPIGIYGLNWTARVWPGNELLAANRTPFTRVVLGMGALASVLLGLSVGLAQAATARTRLILETGREVRREIVERAQAEEALVASRALYHSLVENLPAGVFRKEASGRFVFVNEWFCRLKGATADRILGSTVNELIDRSASDPQSRWQLEIGNHGNTDHEEIMSTGRTVELEEIYLQPDGSSRYFQVIKAAVLGPDGAIVGSQGILFDITALKSAEAALSETSALLERLLENTTDYIYFKDLQSRFTRFSKSMLGVFGLSEPAELMGRSDLDFFVEDYARLTFESEQRIIGEDRPLLGVVENQIFKDGRESWTLSSKMPLRDEAGRIIGTFGISKDITKMKQGEAELEAMHRQLLETSRQAGMAEVATSVLHNVGNVLNSVNVSCSLVAGKVRRSHVGSVAKIAAMLEAHAHDLPGFFTTDPAGRKLPGYLGKLAAHLAGEQAGVLQEIQLLGRNVDHIKEIVAMQQDYAKVSGVAETLQVADLMEDSLRIHAGSLSSHAVEIVREYGAVPPILVEKHKALQILVNLIRNATQACDDSGRRDKRITLRVSPGDPDFIRIDVIDNGVGIPPQNLTRIFAHGFTTKADGHGFGLHSGALAAGEMGGRLTVHSAGEGTGAAFTLILPVEPPSSANVRS